MTSGDSPSTSELPSTTGSAAVSVSQTGGNKKYTRQGNPNLGPLTGREKEFEELGDLTELYEGLSTKTRQHVNPLATHYQVPTQAPDWTTIFANPTLPLHVDVGCGSGRFVLIRARRLAGYSAATDLEVDAADPETCHGGIAEDSTSNSAQLAKAHANVLGMEIRQKLVERAQGWRSRLKLTNCWFVHTNATVSWRSLLESYPGPIALVSMQFPDPYFKTRHHKRRHVQPQLVKEMAQTLAPGARVFLQGDVPEAVRWMRDMMEQHGDDRFAIAPECQGQVGLIRDEWETTLGTDTIAVQEESIAQGKPTLGTQDETSEFSMVGTQDDTSELHYGNTHLTWSADAFAGWLPSNPLGVPTEREVYVSQINAPVYRVMLVSV